MDVIGYALAMKIPATETYPQASTSAPSGPFSEQEISSVTGPGGIIYGVYGTDMRAYDSNSGTWTQKTAVTAGHSMTAYQDEGVYDPTTNALYFFGKYVSIRYNIAANTWTTLTALPNRLGSTNLARLSNNTIAAVTGEANTTTTYSAVYDIAAGTWTAKATYAGAKSEYGHGGRIKPGGVEKLLFGPGYQGGQGARYGVYNPASNVFEKWDTLTNISPTYGGYHCSHAVICEDSSELWFFGGGDTSGNNASKDAWKYNWDTDAWTRYASVMTYTRRAPMVGLMADGRILIHSGRNGGYVYTELFERGRTVSLPDVVNLRAYLASK